MIIIAASLYLPSHIATICSRAFYYYAGDVQHPSPPLASAAAEGTFADTGKEATAGVAAGIRPG
jgi:hypothetical protein